MKIHPKNERKISFYRAKNKKFAKLEMLHGPLNLVLRLGRIFGVAPIVFNKKEVVTSSFLFTYSFLTQAIFSTMQIIALAMDVQIRGLSSIRLQSPLKIIIWFPDITLNLLTSVYGMLYAPWRMTRMIGYMESVEKIKADLGYRGLHQRTAMKRRVFFLVTILIQISLLIVDFILLALNGVILKKNLTIVYLYGGYYVQYFALMLLEMQFVFVVFCVNDLFSALNLQLEEIQRLLCLQARLENKHAINLTAGNTEFKKDVLMNTFNTAALAKNMCNSGETGGYYHNYMKTASETVLRLTRSYNEICAVVRQVDFSHGPFLLLLILIMLLRLVLTPFHLYFAICVESSLDPPELQSQIDPVNHFVQSLWCFFHLYNLLAALDPCHKTKVEIKRIRVLISELISKVSHADPLAIELNRFFKILFLNTSSFTIMNLATLGRPLVASILGSVTTYLIILIQFQGSDTEEDDVLPLNVTLIHDEF